MKIIICIDIRFGISFLGKRQSRDEAVVFDVLKTAGENRVLASEYSAPLFGGRAIVFADPLAEAGEGDYCFSECTDITPFLGKTDELILYNWNRHYPSDIKLLRSPEEFGFVLSERYEFSGKSHEKITKEIYKR